MKHNWNFQYSTLACMKHFTKRYWVTQYVLCSSEFLECILYCVPRCFAGLQASTNRITVKMKSVTLKCISLRYQWDVSQAPKHVLDSSLLKPWPNCAFFPSLPQTWGRGGRESGCARTFCGKASNSYNPWPAALILPSISTISFSQSITCTALKVSTTTPLELHLKLKRKRKE